MRLTRRALLIVDDDPVIRASMQLCLSEIGYPVRTAEDGLDALILMGDEAPEILLTDLNMPRMSGFELLAHVHQQFPAVQTIAMSGAFCGDDLPSGVLADAFFQKGSSIRALLKIIEDLPSRSLRSANRETNLAPFWIRRNNHGQVRSARPKGSWPA
jgi:CheY-like chemotaxis protein